jgi:hypothetical protein
MTTLASFVTEFGFKTDGSFEKAIQGMQKRLGALGTSVNGIGEGMSKSMQAAAKRLQVSQMNMQTQAMKSEIAKMAAADKAHLSKVKQTSIIGEMEAKIQAAKLKAAYDISKLNKLSGVTSPTTYKMADSTAYTKAPFKVQNDPLRIQDPKIAERAAYFTQKERLAAEAYQKKQALAKAKESEEGLVQALRNLAAKQRLAASDNSHSNTQLSKMREYYKELEAHSVKEAEALRKKQALTSNPDAHVYAFKNAQMKIEAEHAKALRENAKRDRDAISRDNKAERDKVAAALKYQRVQEQEMSRIHTEALRENARITKERLKAEDSFRRKVGGGSGGSSGGNFGGIGGIPVMGRATLGMMASGFGISEMVRQSYQMANFQAKMMPTFKFVTKDENKSEAENLAAANVEKNFINSEVARLSLERGSATKSYQGMLGATYKTLGSQGSQDLFTGIQQVGMMTGRSSEEMHRAFIAIQQMASKGRITQEELNFRLTA